MARGKTGAREKAEEKQGRGIKFVLAGIALLFAGFLSFSWQPLSVIGFPLGMVGVILIVIGFFISSTAETWELGAAGEEEVIKKLDKLGEQYKVFNDLVLPGETSNTDHAVVSKKGIQVMETKNLDGKIRCEGDSWERVKTGKRGKEYQGNIGSPSKQVKRNAMKLKEYLNGKCPEVFENRKVFFEGIVVFTNPEAELDLSSPTVKVTRPEELKGIIEKDKKDVFTEDEVRKIEKALKM
ncbi:MAG: nuclease-related domain-containing protein [Archaeoglobaceae archaeon]